MPTRDDRRPDRTRRKGHRPRLSGEHRQGVAVLLAAVAAPFASAAPIGVGALDVIWCAALGALAAYLGSLAKRGPLLFAAIVALLASRTLGAGAFAVLAAVSASLSTRHLQRRAFFARGIAGGAAAISVMATGASQPASLTLVAGFLVAASIGTSGYQTCDRRQRRWLKGGAIAAGSFAVVASGLALIGAAGSIRRIDAGTAQLELGLSAARQGDAPGASAHLQLAQAELHRAQANVQHWGRLGQVVPFTAQHVDALDSILGQVQGAAGQAIGTASATNMDDLTVQAGRIDVDEVAQLENPFRRLAATLGRLVRDVDHRVHAPLVPAFKDRLVTIGDQARRAQREAALGADGARDMPRLLGSVAPKRYLVLFTSPAEARGRLGFPASFAEVTMDRGRLLLGEHGSTSLFLSRIDPSKADIDPGGELLRPYLTYGTARQFLSVTVPPDFPTVADVAARLWTSSGRAPVDGVLRFDPASLAALMVFTGPVKVDSVPEPLTAANLQQFLVFGQYVQFPNDVAPRREVLQAVSDATFERLQVGNLPQPRTLIQLFAPLVHAGHLDAAAFDRSSARLLGRAGIDGTFRAPPDDGVMVANVNTTANKIDSFLTKAVTYEGKVEDGRLTGAVAVELTNHAPASRLPFYVIGSATTPPLPKGTNRTTLFVYTAVEPGAVLVDGQPVATPAAVLTGGWWLRQVPLELPPGATRTVRIALDGPLRDADHPYQLRLEPGGGALPETYRVRVTAGGRRVAYEGAVPTGTVVQ